MIPGKPLASEELARLRAELPHRALGDLHTIRCLLATIDQLEANQHNCGCGGITPVVWKNQVPDEVYLVVQNRRDDVQPGAEKTAGQRWHANLADARDHLDFLTEDTGPYYGVYKAHVIVLECVT